MEIVKIIGISALILFLVAYIGNWALSFIDNPTGKGVEKIIKILGHVSAGAFTLAGVCGIISLFA